MLALWLADVLVAAGLDVVEQPGWTLRGKPMDAIEGTVTHHTASPIGSNILSDLAVCTNGTNGTPGPIAQVLISRSARCYVIAAGKANHAGAGGPIAGWMPLSPPGQLSYANARCIGFECVNNGIGEPWPDVQLDAMEIANAAVLNHIGQPVAHAITHAEWAPTRKIDPAGPTSGRIQMLPGRLTWSPVAWRERIADRMSPPAPIEEDDMPAPVFIGTPEGAQYLWVPGCKPQAFENPAQRDLILAKLGIDPNTGVTLSSGQVDRLFWNA